MRPADELAPGTAFGPDVVERLPSLVDELGAASVLLVCGSRSFEASGAARVLPALERTATVTRWSGFRPNPDVGDLRAGLDRFEAARPDLVVGVGGGTALDLAKLISVYAAAPGTDLHGAIRAGRAPDERPCTLVLVPTTSGSGSEATRVAIVYIEGKKFSIASPAMRPDRTLLDPLLAVSAPPYQRASTGIDALSQAIESLWAVSATSASRAHARAAIPRLLRAIEGFVRAPEDDTAIAMSLGSHLAGRAIDVTKTTAAHALSYGITQTYGLAHGHAVATTLGPMIAVHAAAVAEGRTLHLPADRHQRTMTEVLTAFDVADGQAAASAWRGLLERIGLDPRLSAAGLRTATMRRELADSVDPARLANNPVALDRDALERIIEAAG